MAGGAGGREVERLAVKVVPDTGGFKEDLKEDLEEIERTSKIEVDVEADTAAIKAELKELSRDLKVQLEIELANAIQVRQQLAHLARDLTVMLYAELDAGLVRTQLARLSRDLTVKIKLDLDSVSVLRVEKRLAWITRDRVVNIRVNVDRDQFDQVFQIFLQFGQMANRASQSIRQSFSSATNSVQSFGKGLGMVHAVAIPLLIAAIAVLVGAVAGLIIMLGALVGAVLAVLPPIALIGAGIFYAFKGGGKQAEQLKKRFEAVGKSAKGVLERAIQPMTRELTKQLKPLNEWVILLQGPLNKAFKSATQYIEPLRLGLQNFVDNTLKGLNKALADPGMSAAVQGLSILIADLGTAIGEFFATLAKDGPAFRETFKALGDALIRLAPALARMLGAFATVAPDIIERFTDALIRIMNVLSNPTVLNALKYLANFSWEAIAFAIGFLAGEIVKMVNGWRLLVGIARWAWGLIQSIWGWITEKWNEGAAIISSIASRIKNRVVSDFNGLMSSTMGIFSRLWGWISSIWDRITGKSQSGSSRAKTSSIGNFLGMADGISGAMDSIVGIVQWAWERISSIISNISGAIGRVRGMISGLANSIRNIPMIPFSLAAPDLGVAGVPMTMSTLSESTEPAYEMKAASVFDDIDRMAAETEDLRSQYLSRANETSEVSAATPSTYERNYYITQNAVPGIPTERQLITALGYVDALFAE
jgi:phage-related protein